MKTLHPIDAFGISEVTLSSIRVDRLEERIDPKVPFPHMHDFFQLILITHGSGWHQIDFKKHQVLKSQVYLMKPGQIHTWSLRSSIKGFVIEFNRSSLPPSKDLPDLISPLDFAPDLITIEDEDNFKGMINLCELMQKESQLKSELQDAGLKGLLCGFLVQILRHIGTRSSKAVRSDELLEKFRDLVEEHFSKEHRVEFYAQKLGMTPKALTMQLSRTVKRSPRLLIQDRFLLEAKRYLAYSDLSISDIGYKIGFEDPNYFSRFFRLHEKMTPAQFRKSYQTTWK